MVGRLLASLARYGSRKWLAAICGNVLLGLFARWLVPALAAIQPALAWLGLGVVAALAVGLWVYVIVEGKLDLERIRQADPARRARALLDVYQAARKQGLSSQEALELLSMALDAELGRAAQLFRSN